MSTSWRPPSAALATGRSRCDTPSRCPPVPSLATLSPRCLGHRVGLRERDADAPRPSARRPTVRPSQAAVAEPAGLSRGPRDRAGRPVVGRPRLLRGVRPQLRRLGRRRHRRPARADRAPRLPQRRRPGHERRPGRDRAVADADRRVAELPRLRRRRLSSRSRPTTARPTTSGRSWRPRTSAASPSSSTSSSTTALARPPVVPGCPDARARSTTTGTSGPTSSPPWLGPTEAASGTPTASGSTTATSGRACRTSTSRTRRSRRSSTSIGEFWLEEMGVDGFRIDAARHLIEDGRQLENTDATFDWLVGFRSAAEGGQARCARPRRGLGRVLDVGALRPRRCARPDLRLRARERHDHLAAIGRRRLAPRRRSKRSRSSYPPGGLATFLTNHDQDRIMTELDGDVDAARARRDAAPDRRRARRSSTTARRSG